MDSPNLHWGGRLLDRITVQWITLSLHKVNYTYMIILSQKVFIQNVTSQEIRRCTGKLISTYDEGKSKQQYLKKENRKNNVFKTKF